MSMIDDMMKQYINMAELQEFAKAQHKTILDLTKKISKLEEEKKHLEKLIGNSVPILVGQEHSLIKSGSIIENHEENICRMELKKLHDISMVSALTLEEAKKVELYTKLLLSLHNQPKKVKTEEREVSTEDLLQIVETEEVK